MLNFISLSAFLTLLTLCTCSNFQSQPFLLGAFMPTPKYISSLSFQNQSGQKLILQVDFKSQATGPSRYDLQDGTTLTAEKQIDCGTWKKVNPIIGFRIIGEGWRLERNNEVAVGIERRRYVMGRDRRLVREDKV